MDIFQTIVLSIVEGITEFLPISSTGHLILASNALRIPQTEFLKSFEIAIQLGAILAVVILYWKTLLMKRKLWLVLLFSFIPTAILGFLFYDFIKLVLLENTTVTLISLFVGGVVLIVLEKFYSANGKDSHIDDLEKLTLPKAIGIGLAQSLSMIPGVSRAAATIFGGLFSGLSRKAAVEFSFLLAIPTMTAATGLDLLKSGFLFNQNEWMILSIGFAGAFITALFAVKFFLKYIQNHTFIAFGVYRIILALLFWVFVQ
jgi:undecaprenyl-diphosphatase